MNYYMRYTYLGNRYLVRSIQKHWCIVVNVGRADYYRYGSLFIGRPYNARNLKVKIKNGLK